jgi:hypothetical protein
MPGGDRKSWCSEPEKLGWLTPRWGSQIVSQADVNLHCDEPKTSFSDFTQKILMNRREKKPDFWHDFAVLLSHEKKNRSKPWGM